MFGYEKLYEYFSMVLNCIVVNVLFLCGTLCGGIIFGIGPSLLAGHEVFMNYHLYKKDTEIFKTFVTSYKRNFTAGNKIFLPFAIGTAILIGDTYILQSFKGELFGVLIIVLILVQVLFITVFSCILPMFHYYQLTVREYFKAARKYVIQNPLIFMGTLLWCGIFVYGSLLLPGLVPLASIGIWMFGNSAIFFKSFERNERLLKTKE